MFKKASDKKGVPPGLLKIVSSKRKMPSKVFILVSAFVIVIGVLAGYFFTDLAEKNKKLKVAQMQAPEIHQTYEKPAQPSQISPLQPNSKSEEKKSEQKKSELERSPIKTPTDSKTTKSEKHDELPKDFSFPYFESHIYYAQEYERKGEYEKAIDEYLKYLQHKKEPDVLNKLAILYMKINNLNQASLYIEQALNIKPNDLRYLTNYGVILAKMNKHDKALEIFQKVLNIEPQNHTALYNLAIIKEKQGDLQTAKEIYKKLASAGDRDAELALKRLGD
ncbi:tetratricopeptide repeat protein [Thermodesulfovibrio hydrogeniphilus]